MLLQRLCKNVNLVQKDNTCRYYRGGSGALDSPRSGLGLCYLQRAVPACCKCAVQTGPRRSRQSQEEERSLHGTAAWHSHPPNPPPLILLWLHLLHVTSGHWRQPQPQLQWRGNCSPASSCPALIEKRGEERVERVEKLPAKWPAPEDPRSLRNEHWALLTYGFPGEFEDWRGKGEACRAHQSTRGAVKGTGKSLERNPSGTEMLSGERAIIFLPFLLRWKEPARTVLKYSSGTSLSWWGFPLVHWAICWPLQRNPSPAEKTVLQDDDNSSDKTGACCVSGKCSLLAAIFLWHSGMSTET